jgi:hypothetical protein
MQECGSWAMGICGKNLINTRGQLIYPPFGTSTPQNQASVANAGSDQTVNKG